MSTNLLELLKEHLSGDVISNISSLIGESPENTELALNAALPSLLAGLAEKKVENGGAGNLFEILTGGGHDGGVLSNLGAISRGGDETAKLMADGSGLLESFFGDKSAGLADLVANASGINKESASKLLCFITPIIMGLLGKHLKIESIDSVSGLTGLLHGQSGFLKNFIPPGLGSLLSGGQLQATINQVDTNPALATIVDTAKNVLSDFDKATAVANPEKTTESADTSLTASLSETFDKVGDVVENAAEASFSVAKETAANIGDKANEIGAHVVTESKDFAQSAAHAFEEGAGESRKLLPWILIAAALALIWGLLKSCASTTETDTPDKSSAQPPAAATSPAPIQPVAPIQSAQPSPPAPAEPEPAQEPGQVGNPAER